MPAAFPQFGEREPHVTLSLIPRIVHRHHQANLAGEAPGECQHAVHGPIALPGGSALQQLPLAAGTFDVVWSVNTLHHLPDPLAGACALTALLRPGGHLALGQSSLLPEMYFAWDARFEHAVTEAVRAYYRERYRLGQRDLTAVRGIFGLLRAAGLASVAVRTHLIERCAPLDAHARAWLLEGIFRGTWGERLRPYLASSDYRELTQLCDPEHPRFALDRADFHFIQTFTLVTGTRAD